MLEPIELSMAIMLGECMHNAWVKSSGRTVFYMLLMIFMILMFYWGVQVADVVKAPALVVWVAPAWVRTL